MKIPIYMIVFPTGQVDDEGVESVIVIDVKLTKMSAEQVQRVNPGSKLRKMIADKDTAL